jgi:hypothetical protein
MNRESESVVVYYESIKREPKIRGIKKCRCDERLKLKQRNLRASHTLCGCAYKKTIFFFLVFNHVFKSLASTEGEGLQRTGKMKFWGFFRSRIW